MADPTLTDLLDAIAAMRAEMRTSFVEMRTDREKLGADIRDAIARDRAVIMSRMEGMENRLTALLLADMVRALEGRVSKLERGGRLTGHRPQ